MSVVDAQRFAFIMDRLKKGWTAEVAGPVAWSLTPFDDTPVPPRQLEKKIRKRCKSLSKEMKAHQSNPSASLELSIVAAKDYVALAQKESSSYFVELWSKLETQAVAARQPRQAT